MHLHLCNREMPRNRYSYRRRSEDSSDENEDNFRHDRFRSERYPENNYEAKRRHDNRDRQRDHKRHRSRSRSPHYRSRTPRSGSESLKKEHKNISSDTRSKKSVESPSKKSSVETNKNAVLAKSKQKTNLSDLLKRFDESTKKESAQESSNGCSSSSTVSSKLFINDTEDLSSNNQMTGGPVLPLHLQKPSASEVNENSQKRNDSSCDRDTVDNTSCETSSEVILSPVGPSLPTYLQKPSLEDKIEKQECKLAVVNVEDRSPQNNTSESVSSYVELALSLDVQKSVSEKKIQSECQLPETAIGPALPPHLQNYAKEKTDENNVNNSEESDKNEPEYYGPSLPPSLKKVVKKIIGPVLPPDCKMEVENVQEEYEEDDEDFVGPVPEDSKERASMVQQKLDFRAMEIKIKMLEGEKESNDTNKRESWMLELPPERAASLGLGPRTFRTRDGPDMGDRSCWTDTPADKLQKLMKEGEDVVKSGKDELRRTALSERDRAMEELAKERSADKLDKPLSLLEIHQQNMRKKKMKEEQEGKKPERRPFDRNIDLQVNRFDEAQKKAIFKKAQLLDSRFSQGESKYL